MQAEANTANAHGYAKGRTGRFYHPRTRFYTFFCLFVNPGARGGTACKGPAPRTGGAMAGQAAAPFWAAMMAGGAVSMVGPGGRGDGGGGLEPGCEGESEGL